MEKRHIPRIGERQFDLRQPEGERSDADVKYYLDIANKLIEASEEQGLLMRWNPQVISRAAMIMACYMQDVVADGGLWRSFVNEHHHLYGRYLPFYDCGNDYIPHELNPEDVRFMLWYALAMTEEGLRLASPLSEDISEASGVWHDILDARYDDAPVCGNWTQARTLELTDPDDVKQICSLGNWLFMYGYLTTPAYSLTLGDIMRESEMRVNDPEKIEKRLEQSMSEDPTGPLALYIGEWLKFMIEGRPLSVPAEKSSGPRHPYYDGFMKATGGSRIKFLGSYTELNGFLIKALGWASDREHLQQVKGARDYVLLVDEHKGMLLARDICRCIKLPENPYYDEAYARDHAIELLTVRGACPADLLSYLRECDAIPDARFPGTDDTALVKDNFDFIARCYLQKYYRGD